MPNIVSQIEKKWSQLKSKKVFVAASGGLDSTVLIYILNSLRFNLEVLHVNYNLRGEDSHSDAKFVVEFCESKNIKCSTLEVELQEQLKNGGNMQQIARDVRYNWFEEKLNQNPQSFLALGHHQDDQVETFFLNIARKSGVLGMASMLERNGRFIRPLLSFSKNELESFANEHKVSWREDISNQSNKYRRNFLRNTLIPLMENEVPELKKSVICLIHQFQKTQLELEKKLTPIVKELIFNSSILIKDYTALNELEKNELIRQLGQNHFKQEELDKLIAGENGKRVELKRNNFLSFDAIVKSNETFHFVSLSQKQDLPQLKQEIITELPSSFSKEVIYLDELKIQGELRLRFPENGDRIKSVGMRGSQLISDVIKDAKLSLKDKNKVALLIDDNEIHWCVGLKVGRAAIANSDSQQIVKLSITTA